MSWRFALVAGLVCAALFPPHAVARVWNIKADGTGDLRTIQNAANVVQPGDRVVVGPGRYTWTTQGPGDDDDHGMIVLWTDRPNGVTFESSDGPEATILDAQGKGRVMFANGMNPPAEITFTIRGFTLRGGVAPDPPNSNRLADAEGGALAMHLAYATIENCIFEDNWAESGGAVWLGGVSSCVFRNCVFRNNTALYGGGILIVNSYKHTLVQDCLFEGNVADARGTLGGLGGGVLCWHNNYTVERCRFWGNGAVDAGAGFAGVNSDPGVLRDNVFRNHDAAGATVFLRIAESAEEPNPNAIYEVTRNVITRTSPGKAVGMELGVEASFQCNDFFGNFGGNWSDPLVRPFLGENGNVATNPLFCSTEVTDLSVCQDSPLLPDHSPCGELIGGLVTAGCDSCGVPEPEPAGTFRTYPAAPNPFHVSTSAVPATIFYELPQGGRVRAVVYDLKGRYIRTLSDQDEVAGVHPLTWTGRDDGGTAVASGVYVCRIEAGGLELSQRIVLVR